jgi:glycine/D-amino acid oxidase-like deaminating enzyme/nitrite reductase/ring-hydroxylating ferredoxin subunit
MASVFRSRRSGSWPDVARRRDEVEDSSSHRSFWIATSSSRSYRPLDTDVSVDVAVVGAGIVGITTAALLRATGREVALIEAGRVAAGVTGHTTAKVTSLHTLIYDELTRTFGEDAARVYGEANETGLAEIRRIVGEHGIDCELDVAAAHTFAAVEDDAEAIEREVVAALALGLPARYESDPPVPFRTFGGVRFDRQAQFHPRKYLLALVEQLHNAGSLVYEQSRIVDIDAGQPARLTTEAGHVVTATDVIVATHAPILDTKLLPARASVHRGYAMAIDPGEQLPEGMFISASSPSHSVRVAPFKGREVLIVSGEGHPVGEPGEQGASENWQQLERWASDQLGAGQVLFRWSTQDLHSLDRLPFIGALDQRAKIFTATGFGGWGMTGGTAAAMLLRDLVEEIENPWADLYNPSRFELKAVPALVRKGAHDAKRIIADRLGRDSHDITELDRGSGQIVDVNGEKLAVSREREGALQAVSAVCTHLGCIVSWNDAEHSWDCPCHGSRFSPAGALLHGPATNPLADKSDLLP